jgi:hypothetical protein
LLIEVLLGRNQQEYFSSGEQLLADGIYYGPHFITPFTNLEASRNQTFQYWSRAQRRQRAIVEWTNGYIERFRAVVIRFHHSIPIQSQTILAAALLSNRQLKLRPFREI